MPVRSLKQTSFFDPEFAMPGCLVRGTVPWLLARRGSVLFPRWLFRGWRDSDIGRDGWPAGVLAKLLLLRWTEEGMSRRCSERRAKTDVVWRAAMGIALDKAAPSERTLRDFEAFLGQHHPDAGVPRGLLMHEHFVRLCRSAGVVGEGAIWATDSTPMWCYGAVKGTVRLLGDGLRALGIRWARATGRPLPHVASELTLPLLLGKSTKGALEQVDWRDPDSRADGMDRLARDVLRVTRVVRSDIASARRNRRKELLQLCRALLRVVRDDLEVDSSGRLTVARRVARDRLVSITDREARAGRKSSSKVFKGFKLHIVGDVTGGLIASVSVTAGNVHDGVPAARLFGRASKLFEQIEMMLGDTAYGGAALRDKVRAQHGIELVAPPPPQPRVAPKRFGKAAFEVDFDRWEATCPAGATASQPTWGKSVDGPARFFTFSASDCRRCSLAAACLPPGRTRRSLLMNARERTIRESRQTWLRPDIKALYRERSKCERLVRQMTRHGGRQARAWGLRAANLQAHAIASVCNLGLLAAALAQAP